MNNTTHDEYGFPLVYEKTALAQMQAKNQSVCGNN